MGPSIIDEIKNLSPLWIEETYQWLEYLRSFNLSLDKNDKSVFESIRFLSQISNNTTLIPPGYEPEKGLSESLLLKCDNSNLQISNIKDSELIELINNFVLKLDLSPDVQSIIPFFKFFNHPYILRNPRTGFGKKAWNSSLKVTKDSQKIVVLVSNVSIDKTSYGVISNKDSIKNIHDMALQYSIESNALKEKILKGYFNCKLVVTNKHINKKKFKSIEDFWDQVEPAIFDLLRNEGYGGTQPTTHKSPKSYLTLYLRYSVIREGFNNIIELLKNTDLPISTTIDTYDWPQNKVLANFDSY